MTEFYQHEQSQTKLTEPSPLFSRSNMPSFYPSTRHRTLITKHLTEHDEEDEDPNSIYKDAFIVQIFQHWKIKTLEHQQALNNATNFSSTNHFSQALATQISPVETSNTETIRPPETSFNTNEPKKPPPAMQKRVTPVPASYLRRKEALKKTVSTPTDSANPNLLVPSTNNRARTASAATRKVNKPSPIFIPPKKTQPSPVPRSYSHISSEESNQTKRKPTSEKQNSITDDQNSPPISPTWAPAPPTLSSIRFHVHSPGNSLDDDETSSDDGSHESLLIRNKNRLRKPIKTGKTYPLPSNITIPAVLITDSYGHSHVYDSNSESLDESTNSRIIENEITSMDFKSERSASDSSMTYALHSIGEEEEEAFDKTANNGIILSKELNRIEAYKRSRQTNSNGQNKNTDDKVNENEKIRLGRRWSDGFVSDDDEEHTPSSMVKMASTTSVLKHSANAPPKISKTKQFLMKLHLASPSKNDDSNAATTNLLPPASRKRTVRRSSDKKRYQTQ